MAQIIRRGENRWLVRVFVGRDAHGKRQFCSHTVDGTWKHAKAYAAAREREQDHEVFVQSTKDTLNEFLARWFEDVVRRRVRPQTVQLYEKTWRRYIRETIGGKRLTHIAPLDIEGLYTRLKGGEVSGKALSFFTIRHVHILLHDAFKQAVRWRVLARNPIDGVTPPSLVRKATRTLAPDEVCRLQAAADRPPASRSRSRRLGTLIAFALETGMRPSEYLGLQWQDINLTAGLVSVRRVLVDMDGGGVVYGEPKTKQSRRIILISGNLCLRLKEHYLASEFKRPEDPVFATWNGTPLRERDVAQHFKRLLAAAGLDPRFRLYDLRRTHAALMLAAGANVKVLSERLGYSSANVTFGSDSRALPKQYADAMDKFQALLNGARAKGG